MSEKEPFDEIDIAIEFFKKNDGARKGIRVSKKPPDDWLVFNWRQLTWVENKLNYLIEIYPNFNSNEEITDWNLYAATWYDDDSRRYSLSKRYAENKSLDQIANNADELILEGYRWLAQIKKEQIPFAVELKK